jgi:hypothetical protein
LIPPLTPLGYADFIRKFHLTVAEKRGKKALFIKKLPGFPLKHIEKWGQNSIEYIDFLCFLPFPPQLSNSLAIFALKNGPNNLPGYSPKLLSNSNENYS